ncbi:MAG: lytic transglycosylase domain-containing protein [Flavobacteriales bacterium]|nr:lytic transglycosylase domain-containing protein [Flavobacteriales bacterium]
MKRTLNAALIFIAISSTSLVAIQLFTASTFEGQENEKYHENFENSYNIFALNLPTTMDFAGEAVPLNLIDVREKMDRELLVNTYWQSQTLLLLKRSHRWFPLIEKILEEEGIPDDFKYLALMESGLTQIVSPAGATGFWQLMKDAARERGLEVNNDIDERYHIEKSTYAACAYLRDAKEKFGSWTLAAASYNMGMSGINVQLERQKATNYYDLVLNEETSRYIFRILAAKTILGDPKSYGFNFREDDLYKPLKFKEISANQTIPNLADFAFENGINYKTLKYLNPWMRDNHLPNSSGKAYVIKLPTEPLSAELVNDKEQVANFARSRLDGTDESGEGNTTE